MTPETVSAIEAAARLHQAAAQRAAELVEREKTRPVACEDTCFKVGAAWGGGADAYSLLLSPCQRSLQHQPHQHFGDNGDDNHPPTHSNDNRPRMVFVMTAATTPT